MFATLLYHETRHQLHRQYFLLLSTVKFDGTVPGKSPSLPESRIFVPALLLDRGSQSISVGGWLDGHMIARFIRARSTSISHSHGHDETRNDI